MTLYAVTGATGHLGRLAVEAMLARGVAPSDVVAVVRSPSKADALAQRGVEIRVGDYSHPESLADALADVDRLLLVSGSEAGSRLEQHINVIQAARGAGVSRIAYTGILNSGATTNLLAGEHQTTEQILRTTGVPFTLLRNGWYIENYTDQLGRYLQDGAIVGAAGEGRISAASRGDYAAAAAAALLQEGQEDRTYELGGPAFDLTELAQIISDVTSVDVVYRDLTVEQYADALRAAGLDEATAGFVAALDGSIAADDLKTDSEDLAQLLGRPVTAVADVVRVAAAGLELEPVSQGAVKDSDQESA